jgi:LPXTG-site transpeptidase (sortase) family protein
MNAHKPQRIPVFVVILSIVTGLILYYGTGAIFSYRTKLLTKPASFPIVTRTISKIPPSAINIPKIDKNLPVKIASVSGNTWDMFPDAVAWLGTSATPGNGNVILYAHNWRTLWRDLYLLKPGDPIEIQQENVWKKYTVTESRDVDQHDVKSVLSDKNRLTLYTCEGTFDQKRRVVYAEPATASAVGKNMVK